MDIEDRIVALEGMTPSELRAAWRDTYGIPAPAALGAALMRRALAARLQESEAGKITQVELRQLGALGRRDERRKEGRVCAEAKPGTWLSRT